MLQAESVMVEWPEKELGEASSSGHISGEADWLVEPDEAGKPLLTWRSMSI